MQIKDFRAAKRKVPGSIMALIRTAGPFSCRAYPPKRKMASFRLGTTRPGLCREQAGSERESEKSGLGTSLVQSLAKQLAKQLDARVDTESSSHGPAVTIAHATFKTKLLDEMV